MRTWVRGKNKWHIATVTYIMGSHAMCGTFIDAVLEHVFGSVMPDKRSNVCGLCLAASKTEDEDNPMKPNTPRLIDESPPITDGPMDMRLRRWLNQETPR